MTPHRESEHATTYTPAVAMVLVAGVFGAIQPKINAVLGDRLGSAILASLVNFTAALVVVVVVLAFRPQTRATLRNLRSWPVSRWTFSAGLAGALVVLAGALSVETIGVAVFSIAFFTGQITFGVLVDRIGLTPGGRRLVSAARGQAAVLAVVAVVVAQIGRPSGELAVGLVALSVAAGAGVAFQSAFNGRIAATTGDAYAATSVNVVVGLTALAAVVAVMAATGHVEAPNWPAQPWLYVGGVLGVSIVFAFAIATPTLGVLWATIVMLAAQLSTAFVVDWTVGDETPRPAVIAGALLVVVAAVLVRRSPQPPAD